MLSEVVRYFAGLSLSEIYRNDEAKAGNSEKGFGPS